jgi:hypothetical protein
MASDAPLPAAQCSGVSLHGRAGTRPPTRQSRNGAPSAVLGVDGGLVPSSGVVAMPALLFCTSDGCEGPVLECARDAGFDCDVVTSLAAALDRLAQPPSPSVLAVAASDSEADSCWSNLLAGARSTSMFTAVLSRASSADPRLRLTWFDRGARMVTDNVAALRHALTLVAQQGTGVSGGRTYTCPACGLAKLTEDELHVHFPLYHSAEPSVVLVSRCRSAVLCLPEYLCEYR